MDNWIRRLTAPVSIILCILIFVTALGRYYGQVYEPPLLLNTKFKYFTKDPYSNQMKPYLWEAIYFKGPGDKAFIRQDVVDGEVCLGLHIYQDGVNDTFDWTSIHVKQEVHGQQVERILTSPIGVYVYPTFSYVYDKETDNPRNVFGLEINDGTNLLWIVFSDENTGTYEIRNHRIIVVDTPLNQWSHRKISLQQYYEEAGWEIPDNLSFIFIMGATKLAVPGKYAGFYKEIEIFTNDSG